MALVTLSEYARIHNLKTTTVRTAQRRGKFLTEVKRHGVWLVDDAEPWWKERTRAWFNADECDGLDEDTMKAMDRYEMIRHYARCGRYDDTFNTCMDMIHGHVREALPVQDVAVLVDAVHDSYEVGYRNGIDDTMDSM